MFKVLVNGSKGKMGQEVIKALEAESDMTCVAQTDAGDDLQKAIKSNNPEITVDFTHPNSVKGNAMAMLKENCFPIIGTTGLTDDDLNDLDEAAKKNNLGILVCPNFAIGAVLMMKFAADAAKYMPRVEIIEMHHDRKADAPSGTAIKTADMIHKTNRHINAAQLEETEILKGARGGNKNNIPIHSIRLPGFVAHQQVIFGGLGQTLTLRHDSLSRESFMPGIILAIRKIQKTKGLTYGLENIL